MRKPRAMLCVIAIVIMMVYFGPPLPAGFSGREAAFTLLWTFLALLAIAGNLAVLSKKRNAPKVHNQPGKKGGARERG